MYILLFNINVLQYNEENYMYFDENIMKIEQEKYMYYVEHIHRLMEKNISVKNIKKLNCKTQEDTQNLLNNIADANFIERISFGDWIELVDEVSFREKEIRINKLGINYENDASIPISPYSSWVGYKKRLSKKGFSDKSIKSIEQSSYQILKSLSPDTRKTGPIKGLVVGNVQSGKTANMAGLMAQAADNGFNYFIILSGVIENLREQTSHRLYSDMKGDGTSSIQWNLVDNPRLNSNKVEHDMSKFNLGSNTKDRYFTVCLKNRGRLESLIKWLTNDKNKAKQLKILVIDDEADQASINTKNIDENVSTINKLIKTLVNNDDFLAMNYISYTATPYANVLNETSKNSLYPKDFIALLEPSEDYIGPKELFGSEEPEVSPYIDIVKEISEHDADIVRHIQSGDSKQDLPKSFKTSIQWFILTVAAMRSLNYKKPISMLVHTSFKITHHEIIAYMIRKYIKRLKIDYNDTINTLEDLYKKEQHTLDRDLFLKHMQGYSTPDKVPNYPKWNDVKDQLNFLFDQKDDEFISHIPISKDESPKYHCGIHLAIDNSKTKVDNQQVRLLYPDEINLPRLAPAFIVVGGNTLSRGLTLEGLTTTYFLRTTNQADTLMQMGRWFGYRKGYEIFPRVWLDELANNRFSFLSQMNEELREEIEMYAKYDRTPNEYAPRIKNSPNYNLIRITSKNKQQSATGTEFDFLGFNSQTIYFDNDINKLNHNYYMTQKFLNSLKVPDVKKNKLIWRNVSSKKVNEFLKSYKVCKSDTKMRALPTLIEWLKDNGAIINNWSIILSGTGEVNQANEDDWKIHGYNVGSVVRTKLKNRTTNDTVSIGTLRLPADLYADIDCDLSNEKLSPKITELRRIREKYGYEDVPQLIIYRINKGDKKSNRKKTDNREQLNFPQDIIGINIMLPGVSKGNSTTYISASLDFSDEQIEEELYEEESESEDILK